MGKNAICWGIFSGELLLPFTIRATKKQCISDRIKCLDDENIHFVEGKLRSFETCRKLVINEFEKS